MTTFSIDGKSHAVKPTDVALIHGPGVFTGEDSGEIVIKEGSTITMEMDNLAPGEAVTITHSHVGPTIFFRPMELVPEGRIELPQARRMKAPLYR